MTRALKDRGVRVPEGFATTAEAYRAFLAHNDLDEKLRDRLADLDDESLAEVGEDVRQMLLDGEVPPDVAEEVRTAYRDLSARYEAEAVDVAVRSSATAEDLPDASFAGQQESFLNVTGESHVLDAVKRCYASLFTDRAIVTLSSRRAPGRALQQSRAPTARSPHRRGRRRLVLFPGTVVGNELASEPDWRPPAERRPPSTVDAILLRP